MDTITNNIKLQSVKIVIVPDYDADTSYYIGEYTDKLEDGVIVRQYGEYYEKLGDDDEISPRGREFRFFKPYAGGEEVGTDNYYEYGLLDYEHMEGLNRGDWQFVAVGVIVTLEDDKGFTREYSDHLGCVEHHGDKISRDYIRGTLGDCLSRIEGEILAAGIDAEELTEKFEDAINEAEF